MKHFKKYSVALVMLFLMVISCKSDKIKDGDYKIEIFATNDVHGRFFDSLYVPSDDGSLVNPYSLASVSTIVNNSRNVMGADNVILLDIGDHLQGDNSTFYYNFVDTASIHLYAKIANYMIYDALVVGNHDIETGHSVYDKVRKQFDMPYLAANAIDNDTNKPYFDAYTIINRHGIKIAVIGLTNPNVASWLAPEIWSGMHFQNIAPAVEQWVSYVKEKDNPQLVVVAVHSGLGDKDIDDIENSARYIAQNVKGIDIVFASHDHRVAVEKYSNNGKDVWLLEGGSRTSNLSKATVSLKVVDGSVDNIDIEAETIKVEGVEADKNYLAQFRESFVKVKEFTNRIIGTLENDIDSRDAYFGPSNYVDMIHSVQLKESGADISFAAPLSFNKHIGKGELNYQNLLDIYPFENQLNVIELTGKEIKDYLEYSYSLWVNKNPLQNGHLLNINDGVGERFRFKNPHYNFDSAAGILYEVDITKSTGERVNIISLSNGDAFDLNRTYTVALTSYRANGGGNLLHKGAGIPKGELGARIVARYPDIRDVIYTQLRADGAIAANKRDEWKFVPQSLAVSLGSKDYKDLFSK